MAFDCFKMHNKCLASCCKTFPIPRKIYENNRHKIVRYPIIECEIELNSGLYTTPTTIDGYCPFLNIDNTCNIYDQRPPVCAEYGKEKHPLLRCHYQDKDGIERTKKDQEKMSKFAKKSTDMLKKRHFQDYADQK